MADKDIVKVNGEPTRDLGNEEYNLPTTRDMGEWMENWNRWFDNVFNRFFDTPARSWNMLPWPGQGGNGTFVPAVNMSESENEFLVTAELPGMTEKDVDLSVAQGTLTIKGEKRQGSEEKGTGWHRVERSYGSFQRTIPLPRQADPNNIEATFKQGVLSVHIPKLPGSQSDARKISIKTETDR